MRPSCGLNFRRAFGVCNFGFGFEECLFLDRRELKTMLQPLTVHLCISRKCTALKWIFRAPLSQNVLRQTLHLTLFLPVVGFVLNWFKIFVCKRFEADDEFPPPSVQLAELEAGLLSTI